MSALLATKKTRTGRRRRSRVRRIGLALIAAFAVTAFASPSNALAAPPALPWFARAWWACTANRPSSASATVLVTTCVSMMIGAHWIVAPASVALAAWIMRHVVRPAPFSLRPM
jgi:hypothetical protein